jgi:hypothetical protein
VTRNGRRSTEVLDVVALRGWTESEDSVVGRVRRLFAGANVDPRGGGIEEAVDQLEFSGELAGVRSDIEELAGRVERFRRICPDLDAELGPLALSARERLRPCRTFRGVPVDAPLVSAVARGIAG